MQLKDSRRVSELATKHEFVEPHSRTNSSHLTSSLYCLLAGINKCTHSDSEKTEGVDEMLSSGSKQSHTKAPLHQWHLRRRLVSIRCMITRSLGCASCQLQYYSARRHSRTTTYSTVAPHYNDTKGSVSSPCFPVLQQRTSQAIDGLVNSNFCDCLSEIGRWFQHRYFTCRMSPT